MVNDSLEKEGSGSCRNSYLLITIYMVFILLVVQTSNCPCSVVSAFAVLPYDFNGYLSYPKNKRNNNISNRQPTWELYELIEGFSEDEVRFDDGQGGVRLAQESAIKIAGHIKHKPGKSETFPMELLRYNTLKEVSEAQVREVLKKVGASVLCTGQGVELYKDPGEGIDMEVWYGPKEAVKDALTNAASAMDSKSLTFNFLGGDDLICGEVLEAANELVLDLDVPTKTEISFNSLCHKSIPSGTCTVTVISMRDGQSDEFPLIGTDKAIASGEIYFRDGFWYTVEESDINTAVA